MRLSLLLRQWKGVLNEHRHRADLTEVVIPSVLVSGDEWDATPGNYVAERVGK